MRAADQHKLPAGGALAVDRHGFSAAVQDTLLAHPLVTLERNEVAGLPPESWDSVIVATGPLTSPALAEAISKLTGQESLHHLIHMSGIELRQGTDHVAPPVIADVGEIAFGIEHRDGMGGDGLVLHRDCWHCFSVSAASSRRQPLPG